MPHPVRAAFGLVRSLKSFAEARSGSAAIEFAIGVVGLFVAVSLAFDLYTRVGAETASARMAVVMADYVSLDDAPSIQQMKKLGEFLNEHELKVPAGVVYVVTALHKPAGDDPVEVLWTDGDSFRFGDDAAVTAELAGGCPQFVDSSKPPAPKLPDSFSMDDDEILIMVEVCARLTREGALSGKLLAGDIYRLHALPARTQGSTPAKPA